MYDFIPAGIPPLLSMLISMGIVILAVTSRHFICLAAGNLSGESEVFKQYLVSVYQSYRFSSVIVFAVVILLVYTVILPPGIIFIIGAIVLITFYLLRVTRLFLIFYEEEYFSFIFDFVPLCAGNFTSAVISEVFHQP